MTRAAEARGLASAAEAAAVPALHLSRPRSELFHQKSGSEIRLLRRMDTRTQALLARARTARPPSPRSGLLGSR
jgi:hypothetical protein